MKKIYKLISVCFLVLPFMVFSQEKNVTSIENTFSGGNNGKWSGNMATDVVKTINAVDGLMDVAVNKVGAPWSILGDYMANCWSDNLVLNQTNRYFEFRVLCNVAVTTPMALTWKWGGCDACCAQVKTIAPGSFVIPEADVWTIVFKTIPASTGGTQNVIDTLTNWFALGLANGNYSFDYMKIGDAAKPPTPTIDAVKTKTVSNSAGVQTVNLTGISIPNRFIDGLTIKAESLSDGIIQDVSILDLGSGPFAVDEATNIATAALQYTPVVGMGGLGDSIIITLKDTIRGTTVKTSFYVNLLTSDLADVSDDITIYPTNVVNMVTIELPEAINGEISVINMVGNIAASQKISGTTAKIDLSAAASGMYIIKISDGSSVVTKKIVKQ